MSDGCGGAVVPSANRGLKGSPALGEFDQPALAIVDFLTFTAPWTRMVEGFGSASPIFRAMAHSGDESMQLGVAEWLVDECFPDSGLRVDPMRRGFRNFYETHFRIVTPEGEQCGFVAMGGERQRSTVCLELTGGGCAHVKAWAHTQAMLESLGAKLTRVDCAHDDFEGSHSIKDALEWHSQGLFNTSGRPPAVNVQGWNDGSGQTVYIGKNTGNQQLCVYEKGRQQGARDGDSQASWVRWEGRFGSKYRDIPLSILTDPAAFLVGHFPPLARWISVVATRMRTSAERAAANLASSIRFAKRQCGALFHIVRKHVPDPEAFASWIVSHVVRERVPAWLKANPHASASIAFSFQT